MRFFKRLTVKGLPFFQDQTFDLSTPGLTIITGLNLEGTSKSASGGLIPNTNFTGKSLFFSQIIDLFFPEGASGTSKDKVSQGEVILELDVGTNRFVLRRYAKGASMRYEVIMNDKDVTPKSLIDQKAYLMQILGHDQRSFEVTYYLDHLRPHFLRTGDTGQRREFFTRFFKLTAADLGKKIVDRARADMKRDTALLVELREQKTELTLVDPAPLQGMLKKATAYADGWSEHANALRLDRAHVQFREVNAKALALVQRTGITDPELAVQSAKDAITKRMASAESVLDEYSYFRNYREDLADYQRAVAKRDAYMKSNELSDEVLQPGYMDDFTAKFDRCETAYNAAYDNFTKLRDENRRARAELVLVTSEMRRVVEEKESLDASMQAGCGTCPTCKQSLGAMEHKLARSVLAAKFREVQARVDSLKDLDDTELNAAQARLTRMEDFYSSAKMKRWILRDLPDVPPEPEAPGGRCPDEEMMHRARDFVKRGESILDDLDFVGSEGNLDFLRDYLEGVDRSYSDEEFDKAIDAEQASRVKAAQVEAKLKAAEDAVKSHSYLEERIKELEAVVADADCIDVLHRAFSSTNGIKAMQIRSLCGLLEAQVNKMSRHIFPNEYTFRFELETQFSIMVTRRVGDHDETTDVRKLSGAEAGLFDLMLSLSLQTFLPERLRCNILIMDELDANFGPAMSQAFVNFLPKLLKVVPHVIVLTPLETDYGEDARYFTVAHRGGRSKILKGRRTQIKEALASKEKRGSK